MDNKVEVKQSKILLVRCYYNYIDLKVCIIEGISREFGEREIEELVAQLGFEGYQENSGSIHQLEVTYGELRPRLYRVGRNFFSLEEINILAKFCGLEELSLKLVDKEEIRKVI